MDYRLTIREKMNMEFRKATLYFGDKKLLYPNLLSEQDKEEYREFGFTDEDFGKVHLVEVCTDYILNPMHALTLFWPEIYDTLKEEAYHIYKDIKHYQIVDEDIETTEVYKIDDNTYSFAAKLIIRVFNPSEMKETINLSNPCRIEVEILEFMIKI